MYIHFVLSNLIDSMALKKKQKKHIEEEAHNKKEPYLTLAKPSSNQKKEKNKISLWDYFSFTHKIKKRATADTIRRQRSRLHIKNIVFFSVTVMTIFAITISFFMGKPQQLTKNAFQKLIIVSGRYGLNLKDVLIHGRKNTQTKDLMNAIQVTINEPLLSCDLNAIHNRLMQNPWIKKVVVQRRLPNVLYIKVEERKPIAIWQRQNQHYLVDSEGVVINATIPDSFKKLIIVVGDDAPLHAPHIIALLENFPLLKKRITGIVRIRNRRWNLTLDDCLTIKLPQDKVASALTQLYPLIEQQKLAKEHVLSVDVRINGQMFIKLKEHSAKIVKFQVKEKEKV